MSEALTRLTDSFGDGRRLLSVLVVVGAIAVVWSLGSWATRSDRVSVSDGVPMESIGTIVDRLVENGISYELERGGSQVTVAEEDLPRARVLLAREGLPMAGSPGFELFDQPSWGMTDFSQRVNYRRALEGELERTLKEMDGIDDARVHLALAESSVLRPAEGSSRASAVLTLRGGYRPEDETIDGIAYLISSSVQGLSETDVTVLDQRGSRLSSSPDPLMAGTDRQLGVRREIENYLESKAEDLVSQVFGPGNASVEVAADLNFDRFDRTTQAVDPDQLIKSREDRAEITPQDESQGASSVTVNAMYETTRSVETLTRSGARIERLSVAVVVDQRRIVDEGGETRLVRRSPEEMQQVESLVRRAVGLSEARGDSISVVATAFDRPVLDDVADDRAATDLVAIAGAAQKPAIALAGMIVVLVLGTKLLGQLKLPAPSGGRGPAELPAGAPATGPIPDAGAMAQNQAMAAAPPAQPLEVGDPEIAAKLLRSWMKES